MLMHFIQFCPVYAAQCNTLHNKLKWKARDIASLLNDPKCIKLFLLFAHTSGRFTKTFGNLHPPANKS